MNFRNLLPFQNFGTHANILEPVLKAQCASNLNPDNGLDYLNFKPYRNVRSIFKDIAETGGRVFFSIKAVPKTIKLSGKN